MRAVLLVFTRHPFRLMMKRMRRRSLVAALLSLAMLSTVSPVASVAGFGDVEDGRYFTAPVQWMVGDGITNARRHRVLAFSECQPRPGRSVPLAYGGSPGC